MSMAAGDPFTITANKNIQAGWTETVCLECTNGLQTIKFPNYVVTQVRDCSTSL